MIWNKGHFYITETAHASLTNLVPDKHVSSHQRQELLCLGSCCAGSPRTSWTLGVLYDSPQVTKSERIINPIHRQCGANHKQTVSVRKHFKYLTFIIFIPANIFFSKYPLKKKKKVSSCLRSCQRRSTQKLSMLESKGHRFLSQSSEFLSVHILLWALWEGCPSKSMCSFEKTKSSQRISLYHRF